MHAEESRGSQHPWVKLSWKYSSMGFPTLCWWCSFIGHHEKGSRKYWIFPSVQGSVPQVFLSWMAVAVWREGLLHKTTAQSGFPDSGKCEVLPSSDWGRANLHLYPKGIPGSLGNWSFWSFAIRSVRQMQSLEEAWLQSSGSSWPGGIFLWLPNPGAHLVPVSLQESFVDKAQSFEIRD